MELTIKTAHSPVWSRADQTSVDLAVEFEEIDGEIPFTASPNDPHEHGRSLFARACAGDFGAIGPYVAAPVIPRSLSSLQFIERFTESEQLAIVTASMQVPAIKLWYDKLLSASDVVQTDPRLIAGMDALVAAGLITAERSVEVLAWT